MLTITVPEALEKHICEKAVDQGTTPELLLLSDLNTLYSHDKSSISASDVPQEELQRRLRAIIDSPVEYSPPRPPRTALKQEVENMIVEKLTRQGLTI